MSKKRVWTISIVASVLLAVGVLASLFGAGFRFYEVKTPSMGTVAPVGTMVIVRPAASYGIGDVVTYERNGRSYTHRIVDSNEQGFITKGDINTAVDALPVPTDQIVGKVVFYGKYLGTLAQGLPAILIGWALVYAITLLPRIRASWRWQIRFLGGSIVVSIVAMWLRPWVNLVMMGFLPAPGGGVDMHLVNTGIFPVSVLGKVISSGQDVVVNQTVLDERGHYTVMPQLALNAGWFLVLMAICLAPVICSLLIRVEDDNPVVKARPVVIPAFRPVALDWRRFGAVAITVTASVLAVVLILNLNTNAAFAASIKNSANTAGTRTWFTCQNAETVTATARFVWPLSAITNINGTDDLKGGRDGTVYGTVPAPTVNPTGAACPRDTTQTSSLNFTGKTCITQTTAVMGTDVYSLEVWFRTSTHANGKLIGFGDSLQIADTKWDRHVYIDATGRVEFGAWPFVEKVVSSPANQNYADGNWHHMMATSASSGVISLYLDGVKVDSRADAAGQVSYSGYWKVGCGNLNTWEDGSGNQQTNWPNYYTGQLRFAAVYDTTLTAQQVMEHYLAGMP